MSRAKLEWLTEQLGTEEINRLTLKFARYKILGAKWREFLAKRRDDDEIWRFRDYECYGETALTIVRNGVPIADFRALGSI